MLLRFEGKVVLGDEFRVFCCDPSGAIHIVEKGVFRDVVQEITDADWGGTFYESAKVTIGICDDTFTGDLFVQTGWGYSEYTPMDTDELRVGDHDLIEILKRYEGKLITLFVSDEPVNILA